MRYRVVKEDNGSPDAIVVSTEISAFTDDQKYGSRHLDYESTDLFCYVKGKMVYSAHTGMRSLPPIEDCDFRFLYDDINVSCSNAKYPDISFNEYGNLYYDENIKYNDDHSGGSITYTYKAKLIPTENDLSNDGSYDEPSL